MGGSRSRRTEKEIITQWSRWGLGRLNWRTKTKTESTKKEAISLDQTRARGYVRPHLEDEEGEEPQPGREVTGHPEGGGGGAEVETGLPEEVFRLGGGDRGT